jgi:hypothetical protein
MNNVNLILKKLLLAAVVTGVFSLLACSENSVKSDQSEHLAPVAIALEDHASETLVAIIFDPEALPDSVSRPQVTLAVGDTVEYHVVSLCLHEAELEECAAEEHDHEAEAHEEGEYSLQGTVSNSDVVGLVVHEHEFALELNGKSLGTADLTVEIWHGSHADVSDKVFQIVVE